MSKSTFLNVSKFLLVFLLTSFNLNTQAQALVAELDAPKGGVDNLKGMVSADSLFLLYEGPSNSDIAMWIKPTGDVRHVSLGNFSEKLLCGIVADGNITRYYFFEASKSEVVIRALEYDESNQTQGISSESLELPGKLLGSYIDKDLYLICASKKDFTVRVIQIHGMKMVEEKIFKISSDLVKDKNKQIAFIQTGQDIKPDLVSAPIKIIKDGNDLYIISDEQYIEFSEMEPPFKTLVSRLNLKTGETVNRIFFGQDRIFSTFAFQNKIYRVMQKDGMRIEVYDFYNAQPINMQIFSSRETYPDRIFYGRIGKNRRVYKNRGSIQPIIKAKIPKFIIADSVSTGKVVLTLGSHFQEESSIPIVGSAGFLPMMFIALSAAVISELRELPTINTYYYLEGSVKDGFAPVDETQLVKQKIDDYEASLYANENRFKYKGYLDGPSATYAIYQMERSTKIQVVKFETPFKK